MESEENAQTSSGGKGKYLSEHNCEYLTLLRHNVGEQTDMVRTSCKTLEEYARHSTTSIHFQSILQLLIELAYFLYACKTYRETPFLDSQDVRVEETTGDSQAQFSLVVWYRLEAGEMEEGEALQTFTRLFEYLAGELGDYLGRNGEMEEDQQFTLFKNQFKMLADCQLSNQYLFFIALEQTSLFFQKSILYRIKNCSLLDSIKTNEQKLNCYRIERVKQQILLVDLSSLKPQNKLQQKQKNGQIFDNVRQFFKAVFQSYQEPTQSVHNLAIQFNFTVQQPRKLCFERILERMQGTYLFRIEPKTLIDCERVPAQLQYFVSYSPAARTIIVKLYNHSIFQKASIGDFGLFRSHSFTARSLTVCVELTERRHLQTSNKQLAFIGKAEVNANESPLQKLLLLIDTTMIASKIYESLIGVDSKWEQKPSKNGKFQLIHRKISHYMQLLIKCGKKVYNQ